MNKLLYSVAVLGAALAMNGCSIHPSSYASLDPQNKKTYTLEHKKDTLLGKVISRKDILRNDTLESKIKAWVYIDDGFYKLIMEGKATQVEGIYSDSLIAVGVCRHVVKENIDGAIYVEELEMQTEGIKLIPQKEYVKFASDKLKYSKRGN